MLFQAFFSVPEVYSFQRIVLKVVERNLIFLHEIDDGSLVRHIPDQAMLVHVMNKVMQENMPKMSLDG